MVFSAGQGNPYLQKLGQYPAEISNGVANWIE